jgi:hypothetical protein
MTIRQIAKTPSDQNGYAPPMDSRAPTAPRVAATIPITRP